MQKITTSVLVMHTINVNHAKQPACEETTIYSAVLYMYI